MTRIASIWNGMSRAARIYAIGLPLAVLALQLPLKDIIPAEAASQVQGLAYWLIMAGVGFISPWLHANLQPPPPDDPPKP